MLDNKCCCCLQQESTREELGYQNAASDDEDEQIGKDECSTHSKGKDNLSEHCLQDVFLSRAVCCS